MIVGLLIYYKAEVVVSIIPIILGVVILFSGFSKLQQAVDLARMKARRWTTVLATACLNLILGGVIIFNPFSPALTFLRFVGIGLLYLSLIHIWDCEAVPKLPAGSLLQHRVRLSLC